MDIKILLAILFLVTQAEPQTARDYYNKIYAVGRVDNSFVNRVSAACFAVLAKRAGFDFPRAPG